MSEGAVATTASIAPAVSSSLPLSTIIGIGVGGFVALVFILGSVAIHHVRKRDRIERDKLRDLAPTGEHQELHNLLRSRLPREISRPLLGLSIIPSFPSDKESGSIRLDAVGKTPDKKQYGAAAAARGDIKRLSPTKAFARITSGIRESWPLTNAGQISHPIQGLQRLQSQSTITLNQVAPPGYMIPPDPQYPSRAYSRGSKTKVSKSPYQMGAHQQDPMDGRVQPSERQLTTILRSTSERLKPSHSRKKSSLSRTLTSFHRPGSPPLERLPTPRARINESREVLLDNRPTRYENRSTVSIDSSVDNEELLRTPTQKGNSARSTEQARKRGYSSTSSTHSEDSVFEIDYPELVIPLSSPNKHKVGGKKVVSMVSTSTSTTSLLQKGSRASVLAFGPPATRESLTAQELPNIDDPFYSGVPPTKPEVLTTLREPRPLFIRKDSQQRSLSFAPPVRGNSPLQGISDNKQTPPRREVYSSPPQPSENPFSWSPQAMRSGSLRPSPSKSEQARKRGQKGHKRSQTVRMSGMRPITSTVAVVPEESKEELSPHAFDNPSTNNRVDSPSISPCPSGVISGRRVLSRPPSASIFRPRITIPTGHPKGGRSTILTADDHQIYSPTLPPGNHYAETPTSEDEFYSKAKRGLPSPNRPPTSVFDDMLAFSTNSASKSSHKPALSPNSEILAIIKPGKISTNDEVLEAMQGSSKREELTPSPKAGIELPTVAIPGHLTGPRAFPIPTPTSTPSKITSVKRQKCASNTGLPVSDSLPHIASPLTTKLKHIPTVKNASRDSVQASVCMLRRMNSEVSGFESPRSSYCGSPAPELPPQPSPSFLHKASRAGSNAYHSMGANQLPKSQVFPSGKEKRDSARILKDKRLQREREAEMEEEVIVDAYPVDEAGKTLSILGLKFPMLVNYSLPDLAKSGSVPTDVPETTSRNIFGTESTRRSGITIPLEMRPFNSPGQSIGLDAASRPGSKRNSLQAGSKRSSIIEAEDEGKENANPYGVIGDRRKLPEKKKMGTRGSLWGDWNGNQGRPDSLGLYDDDGFLKSSPVRF